MVDEMKVVADGMGKGTWRRKVWVGMEEEKLITIAS